MKAIDLRQRCFNNYCTENISLECLLLEARGNCVGLTLLVKCHCSVDGEIQFAGNEVLEELQYLRSCPCKKAASPAFDGKHLLAVSIGSKHLWEGRGDPEWERGLPDPTRLTLQPQTLWAR
ncbi:hypothetical protein J6590_096762 [Homalodisca vitripennis]|nr:hypothetical protein J6590_096762 [Homalodisca vitripennis]